MEKIKGVIFDVDGLILDTESMSLKYWIEEFKKFGIDVDENIIISGMGSDMYLLKKNLRERYGEDLPIDKMYEDKNIAMLGYLKEHRADRKEGFDSLIKYLNENGYKTAIATSTERRKFNIRMKHQNFIDKFDFVVCGSDVKNIKPDPEIFITAAEGIGLSPEECIVLEDSKAGVTAAYKGGFRCINIPDMKKPDDDMKKKAFKILKSLTEVEEYLKNQE